MVGDLKDLANVNMFRRTSSKKEETFATDVSREIDIDVTYEQLSIIHDFELDGYFNDAKVAKLKVNILNKHSNKLYCLKLSYTIGDDEKNILNELYNPFILRLFGKVSNEMNTFYIMEALTGETIHDLLNERTAFSEENSRFYIASVIFALTDIHKKKIAHRNLIPENIALDFSGNVKLINFTLAKKIPVERAWTMCGNVEYLAPEILLYKGYDWGKCRRYSALF